MKDGGATVRVVLQDSWCDTNRASSKCRADYYGFHGAVSFSCDGVVQLVKLVISKELEDVGANCGAGFDVPSGAARRTAARYNAARNGF